MVENAKDNQPEPRTPAPLSARHQEAVERFVLFWGEMASHWSINRTMAQIHALLYAFEDPLDTDEIMRRLQISRGNANMNLRSLIHWNLVRKVHIPGSRKDYYTAEKDVWEITAQIIRERERREIRPVRQQLGEIRSGLMPPDENCADLSEAEQRFGARIDSLVELMEVFEGFSRALIPLIQRRNAPMIRQLIHLAQRLQKESKNP